MTVKAKDAAGNVSAASSALSVTTEAASGTPQHSIWGATAYPWTLGKETGTPLTVSQAFYSYGTSPDVSAWRVVGMKIWIPAGITLTGPIACKGWFGRDTNISATPNATGTLTTPVTGQWNDVIFDTPIETNPGDIVHVGYRIPNGDVLAVNAGQSTFVTALDGSHIVLAESNERRAQVLPDGGGVSDNPSVLHGIDVIYDEGA